MKQIAIADQTLVQNQAKLTFKEEIEIARQLDLLHTNVIELPAPQNVQKDILLVQTVSAFVKNSTLSVEGGQTEQSIENAAKALATAKKARLRVSLPVSAAQMEYGCHLKAPKILALAEKLFATAVKTGFDTEFCALDATRAEEQFLGQMAALAVKAGVQTITLCDQEAALLPDEFADFVARFIQNAALPQGVRVGVLCADGGCMVNASAMLAVKAGAVEVKCCVNGTLPGLDSFCSSLHNCAERCGVFTDVAHTHLHRITRQIGWILSGQKQPGGLPQQPGQETPLDASDDLEAVRAAVLKLGYELSAEDEQRVFEEFKRVAAKKKVTARDLDAIVASVAMQVPPTYRLVSYVVNNGNIISSSAQIKLQKGSSEREGICLGDGPVDAAFRAIEQILGTHYELDDFQIQAVTEGRDSVGSAVVRLRFGGKLFSGTGISTDIIGASIRAYINAVNKIVYEQEV